jgi:CDP-diacylglycerol--serine O-phosphatidyltransferase
MKHIPNFITCLNLFAGCLACVAAFNDNYLAAAIFIYMAAVFDFLDGMAARVLKAYSEIGKQLDSLADMVSFGLAPGVIMYSLLKSYEPLFPENISLLAFLIPIFAALRLAKFNVDTRQSESFLGLAVPANAIFFASFVMNFQAFASVWVLLLLLSLILVFCFLMVSEIPMFSLKFKNFNWQENRLRFIFLLLSAILLAVFQLQAVHLIIVLYIILSVGQAMFGRKEITR